MSSALCEDCLELRCTCGDPAPPLVPRNWRWTGEHRAPRQGEWYLPEEGAEVAVLATGPNEAYVRERSIVELVPEERADWGRGRL
jgi:hypothetical protein